MSKAGNYGLAYATLIVSGSTTTATLPGKGLT